MGQESYNNGSAKPDDRIVGQSGVYRPAARRDSSAVLPITRPGDDLPRRNGSSGAERGGSVLEARGVSALERGVSVLERGVSALDAPVPIAASVPAPRPVDPSLVELAAPAFADDRVRSGFGGSVADHPLLRGLLLELPRKGSAPQPEWMDRWFEAARSIMELIYAPELP